MNPMRADFRWFFVIALALCDGPNAAADNAVWVAGPKPSSCAALLENGESQAWQMWIVGFWSGMNWPGGLTTGSSTDFEGIVASVKKRCQDDPALNVAAVTAALHEDFVKAGR